MDRMLGNQFFLARNFSRAIPHLERVHEKYPQDLSTSQKLVLCYIFTAQLDRAKGRFLEMLRDPSARELVQPAPQNHLEEKELFAYWTARLPSLPELKDRTSAMGILAAFFDSRLAGLYFQKAYEYDREDRTLREIFELFKTRGNSAELSFF